MTFMAPLAAAVLGSLGTVAVAAGFLLLRPERRQALVTPLVSYAAGVLLATATLRLLPQALASAPVDRVLAALLGGLVAAFLLEWLILLRHCHEGVECPAHDASVPLVVLGDGLHNLVDGVVIGAAFAASWGLGVLTAAAVVAHELPQELGDLAVLLDAGLPPRRAIGWNVVSASATLPGAVLAYVALEHVVAWLPYALAVAAATFLYIGLADLTPAMRRRGGRAGLWPAALLVLGVTTVVALGHGHG